MRPASFDVLWREISLHAKCRRETGVPSSVIDPRSGMPLIMPGNRRSGGPDTLCDIVRAVGPGRELTGSLGTSNEQQFGTSVLARLLHENPK
ncbi:unnamed protein product [Haemonchus placei]|uniref:Calponin-homology (CH) domain-containing protein n=1 Tax=Haemonchus placei TaxID=6290 RepID=A0A0N4W2D5_HAEPC|nr:unnamed protein product [Haemonchus placei]